MISDDTKRTHDYELGHTDRELKRLSTQAQLVDAMTRQYFESAGIGDGMRVLDVGSGAGHVAFLAAEMVGLRGQVVGTDKSPIAVETAQENAKARFLSHVSFKVGDSAALEFDQPFDAVVGRYVLMFSPSPVTMLRGVARHLKPGGIIVFHEPCWAGFRSCPASPIYDRCCSWIIQTFERIGTNSNMGFDLYSSFLSAGLPAPTLGLQALIGGSSGTRNGLDLIADLTMTMAPVIEEMGVATAAEIDAGTLHSRMHAEIEGNLAIVVGRYEIGAWTRLS